MKFRFSRHVIFVWTISGVKSKDYNLGNGLNKSFNSRQNLTIEHQNRIPYGIKFIFSHICNLHSAYFGIIALITKVYEKTIKHVARPCIYTILIN